MVQQESRDVVRSSLDLRSDIAELEARREAVKREKTEMEEKLSQQVRKDRVYTSWGEIFLFYLYSIV